MENIQFSRKLEQDSIDRIQGKLDQHSKDLYHKYECMHDAYIRRFDIKFPDEEPEGIECVLVLSQDYIDPQSTIIIKMHEVQELNLMVFPSEWAGNEINYLHFDDCEKGIQATCVTDERVNFRMVVKCIEIREFIGRDSFCERYNFRE